METPSAFPASSSSSSPSAGAKFFTRIANGNRFFWTLIIFSLFKILDVVFSGFGLVYPCLLPISAYESKDAGKKKRNKRKKKPKKRKQKQKLQPQKDDIAIDTLLNQDGQSNNLYHSGDGKGEDWPEEPWQAKDNGWGVRRTSQSAAVVVKNRLTTKTQEARPATLAGIAPMKPTNPPLPVGSGLSGRRKGFMSWIHDAAKAHKKKVLGMKLTTKQTTISGHTIMRSEKTKRSKKDRTNKKNKNT